MGWLNPLTVLKMRYWEALQYPVDVVYILLGFVFSLVMGPLFWYLITNEINLGGWHFNSVVLVYWVFISGITIFDIFDIWTMTEELTTEKRRDLLTLFARPVDPLVLYLAQRMDITSLLIYFVYIMFFLVYGFLTTPWFFVAVLSSHLMFLSLVVFMTAGLIAWGKQFKPAFSLILNYVYGSQFPLNKEVMSLFLVPVFLLVIYPVIAKGPSIWLLPGPISLILAGLFWKLAKHHYHGEGE